MRPYAQKIIISVVVPVLGLLFFSPTASYAQSVCPLTISVINEENNQTFSTTSQDRGVIKFPKQNPDDKYKVEFSINDQSFINTYSNANLYIDLDPLNSRYIYGTCDEPLTLSSSGNTKKLTLPVTIPSDIYGRCIQSSGGVESDENLRAAQIAYWDQSNKWNILCTSYYQPTFLSKPEALDPLKFVNSGTIEIKPIIESRTPDTAWTVFIKNIRLPSGFENPEQLVLYIDNEVIAPGSYIEDTNDQASIGRFLFQSSLYAERSNLRTSVISQSKISPNHVYFNLLPYSKYTDLTQSGQSKTREIRIEAFYPESALSQSGYVTIARGTYTVYPPGTELPTPTPTPKPYCGQMLIEDPESLPTICTVAGCETMDGCENIRDIENDDEENPSYVPPNFTDICEHAGDITKCTECLDGTTLGGPIGAHTALGCLPTDLPTFLRDYLFTAGLGVAGGIAFLLILWGGFTIIISQGDPQKIQQGREIIVSATVGLLFIIFAIVILNIIGKDILNLPFLG